MAPIRRILVHDYSGHPFQVQLSRALAGRGHRVRHLFSAGFQTPKADLAPRPDDAPGFSVAGLDLGERFRKEALLRRRSQEIAFGRLVGAEIRAFAPDIVLSANAPLDAQACIARAARRAGAAFVFWLQDLYSEAMARILPRRLPLLAPLVAAHYRRLESALLRASDHVVAITEGFLGFLAAAGVPARRISVIANWAPLPAPPPPPRAATSGLVAVYAGTLGHKHEPRLLLAAARALPGTLCVHSEGPAAEALARAARREGVGNLVVLPWLPHAALPRRLAEADILLAILAPDAGFYSVPSKVATYLAAGRPVLAALPSGNLARDTLIGAEAGLVADPDDARGFVAGLRRLAADPALRRRLGRNGRRHAETAFAIGPIADRFEAAFAAARAA